MLRLRYCSRPIRVSSAPAATRTIGPSTRWPSARPAIAVPTSHFRAPVIAPVRRAATPLAISSAATPDAGSSAIVSTRPPIGASAPGAAAAAAASVIHRNALTSRASIHGRMILTIIHTRPTVTTPHAAATHCIASEAAPDGSDGVAAASSASRMSQCRRAKVRVAAVGPRAA